MGSYRHRFRTVAATSLVAIALVACRGVLGLDPLPPIAEDASSSEDGGLAADAEASTGDAGRSDPAWAHWPMPADIGPTNIEVGSGSGSGLNHDLVTGLSWQRTFEAPASWAEAKAACEKLELAGRTGFRLPTRIELVSIMDFDPAARGNPFTGHFLDPDWNCYWTISGETDGKTHWLLHAESSMMVISASNDYSCVARCVLGEPYDYVVASPPSYDIRDGVVRDPQTRLEWEAYSSDNANQLRSIEDAEARCHAFALNGHDDWRLPTIKELETLVDERRIRPSLDERVAGQPDVYWSSTPHGRFYTDDAGARLAWRVSFSDGTMAPADDADYGEGTALTRCVRVY